MSNDLPISVIKTVESKINFLLKVLFGVAMIDGVISHDESKIIFSIESNLVSLPEAVNGSSTKGVPATNHKKDIIKIIYQTEDDAFTIAKNDNCITSEEEVLLKILRLVMSEFLITLPKMHVNW